MNGIALTLFLVLLIGLFGGLIARAVKLPYLVGYVVGGIIFGSLFSFDIHQLESLAEVGIILLLFSLGVELSFSRLVRVARVAIVGGAIQILALVVVGYFLLLGLGFSVNASIVLAAGFSLSSTAVVIKLLGDRAELDTIYGQIMVGWLLVQDLAVVPMVVLLPVLASGSDRWGMAVGTALVKAVVAVVATYLIGRKLAPYFVHRIALVNSRELLVLSSIVLALGAAAGASMLGISPALGAFLAGIIISETQENHAVFIETRPLRDIFVILFFVTLGFMVPLSLIVANLGLILLVVLVVFVLKFVLIATLAYLLGYHGRNVFNTGLGLTQIGEFSFVLIIAARGLGVIGSDEASVGVAIALVSIVFAPVVFKVMHPAWRMVRGELRKHKRFAGLVSGYDKLGGKMDEEIKNHIIICGYGRVGGWIGRALESEKVPYVIIDFNRSVIARAEKKDILAVYGDPSEPEILEAAKISTARAVVVAIPDIVTQKEVIARVQTMAPGVKVFSRAHEDQDWVELISMKLEKVVQPEFEAAVGIFSQILHSMGRSPEGIRGRVSGLRREHTMGR